MVKVIKEGHPNSDPNKKMQRVLIVVVFSSLKKKIFQPLLQAILYEICIVLVALRL